MITDVDKILGICAKTGNREDTCIDQLDLSRPSGYSDDITVDYWKAVGKGYKGTIEEFSKKRESVSKIFGVTSGLGGFFTGLASSSNQDRGYVDPTLNRGTGRLSRGAKIGLVSVSLLAVGIIAVIALKNRD